MLVVLNQADLLDADALAACRRDLGRLLAEDGLDGVPVLAASSVAADGTASLREALAERVAAREAAVARLRADVETAARDLAPSCGGTAHGVAKGDRAQLLAALEEAAGVPAVVRAVERAHKRRGALATGWPLVRWAKRLRPDPLRRLHLQEQPDAAQRTSLPGATGVQRAEVSAGMRSLASRASEGLAEPWPALVRRAATNAEDTLPDRLDRRGRRHRAAARERRAGGPCSGCFSARSRSSPRWARCGSSRSRRSATSSFRTPSRPRTSPASRSPPCCCSGACCWASCSPR
jgi:hypothetical protein